MLDQYDLRRTLLDRRISLSVGVQGVIAEFHWSDGDHVLEDGGGCRLATELGAVDVALQGDERQEELTPGDLAEWVYWLPSALACLPGDAGLRELGPDAGAVRELHRGDLLFDMGLGLGHVRACVRTGEGALIDLLRSHGGENVLARGHPAMAAIKRASPHRVFMSSRARIEVFQAIPSRARRETTPMGPHTHVLPALMGRPDPRIARLPADARVVLAVHARMDTHAH